MGLAVGTSTVNLEKRYSQIRIEKNMDSADADVVVEVQTGYYDAAGKWRATERNDVRFSSDRMWFLFGLKAGDLGLTDPNLGTLMETAVYGILAGNIPLDVKLDVIVNDEYGNPVAARYVVKDSSGKEVGYGQTGMTLSLPLYINATINVNKDGYQPIVYTVPVLQGSITATLNLTPVVA